MTCKTYETGTLKQYKYVVIISDYNGKIMLSRHKNRTTFKFVSFIFAHLSLGDMYENLFAVFLADIRFVGRNRHCMLLYQMI